MSVPAVIYGGVTRASEDASTEEAVDAREAIAGSCGPDIFARIVADAEVEHIVCDIVSEGDSLAFHCATFPFHQHTG